MILSEEKWIEISRNFIDAYSLFHKEGKETSWLKLNNRDIEISFLPSDKTVSDHIKVVMYCPAIERILETYFDLTTHDTEEIINKLFWLAQKTHFLDVTKIKTSDSEVEYEQIKEILVCAYKECYFDPYSEMWEEVGTEIRIIELHDRMIQIRFEPNNDWRIDVYIDCVTTNQSCTSAIYRAELNFDDIIRLIQCLAWDNA